MPSPNGPVRTPDGHILYVAATGDSAGFPRLPPLRARMGDVVFAPDPDRFGVVLDAGRVAFIGSRGLLRAPITLCTIAWRIG